MDEKLAQILIEMFKAGNKALEDMNYQMKEDMKLLSKADKSYDEFKKFPLRFFYDDLTLRKRLKDVEIPWSKITHKQNKNEN